MNLLIITILFLFLLHRFNVWIEKRKWNKIKKNKGDIVDENGAIVDAMKYKESRLKLKYGDDYISRRKRKARRKERLKKMWEQGKKEEE